MSDLHGEGVSALICQRCGAILRRDNEGPLCAPCVQSDPAIEAATQAFLHTLWQDRSWQKKAACIGKEVPGGPSWFPERSSRTRGKELVRAERAALRICVRCPVKAKCLRFAYNTVPAEGIWGGVFAERIRLDVELHLTPGLATIDEMVERRLAQEEQVALDWGLVREEDLVG